MTNLGTIKTIGALLAVSIPAKQVLRSVFILVVFPLLAGVSFHGSFWQALLISLSAFALPFLTASAMMFFVIARLLLLNLLVKRINPVYAEKAQLSFWLRTSKDSEASKLKLENRSPIESVKSSLAPKRCLLTSVYYLLVLSLFAKFSSFLQFSSWSAMGLATLACTVFDSAIALVSDLVFSYWYSRNSDKEAEKRAGLEAQPEEQIPTFFGRAQAFHEKKELKIAPFNLEVQLNPTRAEAYLERGKALLSDDENVLAYKDFCKVLELEKGMPQAYHQKGEALAKMKMPNLAVLELEQACRLYEKQGLAKDWQQADYRIKELKSSLAAADLDGKTAMVHTQVFFKPEAIDEIEKLNLEKANKELSNDAFSASAYMKRSQALLQEKKYQAALEDSTRAIQLRADYAEAFRVRAEALYNLNQFEEAIKDFNESLSLKPADADTLRARALCNCSLYRGEEALSDINSAIKLSESNDLKIVRALIFKALSRNQEALSDLSEFIANRTMAVKVWACMLLPIAREISHQLNMTLPEAYRMRSELYEEMGQRQLAQNDLTQAQKLEQKLSKKQPRLKL
ncbi:MAG: tetratricopeptide repeat protein [Candidatus Melainabacteria bacterium]|nr:tetratricopeptide repeat protein [Candidatus Melainabacteria bacterium]